MALTPEQLQRYWDANPDKLAEAIAANPEAFGYPAPESELSLGGAAPDPTYVPPASTAPPPAAPTAPAETTTGYNGDILTYYDSATGKMVTVDTSNMSFAEKMAIKDDNNLVYFTNEYGEEVYGTRPEETYQDPFEGDLLEGTDPYPDREFEYVDDENRENVRNPDGTVQQPIDQEVIERPVVEEPDILDPVITDPVIEEPPDVTDMDPWTGEGNQSDMSWAWDYFQPKEAGAGEWGGYDEDYGAFERYQPGMDSPWGMPSVEGGNRDFYQQQFVNQLRDEQGYQNRERAAQMRRQEAADPANQTAPINYDDMWDSMGFQKSEAVGMDEEGNLRDGWQWNPALGDTTGMTNAQLLAASQDLIGAGSYNTLVEGYQGDDNFKNNTYFSSFDNPDDLRNAFIANQGPDGLDPRWQDPNIEWIESMFTKGYLTTPEGGGPTASAGYAAPTGSNYMTMPSLANKQV